MDATFKKAHTDTLKRFTFEFNRRLSVDMKEIQKFINNSVKIKILINKLSHWSKGHLIKEIMKSTDYLTRKYISIDYK